MVSLVNTGTTIVDDSSNDDSKQEHNTDVEDNNDINHRNGSQTAINESREKPAIVTDTGNDDDDEWNKVLNKMNNYTEFGRPIYEQCISHYRTNGVESVTEVA